MWQVVSKKRYEPGITEYKQFASFEKEIIYCSFKRVYKMIRYLYMCVSVVSMGLYLEQSISFG